MASLKCSVFWSCWRFISFIYIHSKLLKRVDLGEYVYMARCCNTCVFLIHLNIRQSLDKKSTKYLSELHERQLLKI